MYDEQIIKKLYLVDKLSSREIVIALDLPITPRSMQRYLAKLGIARSVADSFRLAVSSGKVKYHYKKPEDKKKRKTLSSKMRYKILLRDNNKCLICGATAKDSRLEIDHIDGNPTNNIEHNLQVLCQECNHGKHFNT